MVPWPVTTPSPRKCCRSRPNSVARCVTNASSSTNDPGSSRRSSRSRAVSLPQACWRSIRTGPPPRRASARIRSRRAIRSAFVDTSRASSGHGLAVFAQRRRDAAIIGACGASTAGRSADIGPRDRRLTVSRAPTGRRVDADGISTLRCTTRALCGQPRDTSPEQRGSIPPTRTRRTVPSRTPDPRGDALDARDRHRQPEGRRRQDDDRDQPRRRARRGGTPGPLHRHGPAGEPHRRPRHQPQHRRALDGRRPGRRPLDADRGDPARRRPRASTSRPRTSTSPATEGELFTALGREQILREALRELHRRSYDYVLIDCPPNLGLLTVNGLVAADSVIIPVQTQYYAMKGLNNLVKVINAIRAEAQPRPADPRPAADLLRRPHEPRQGHAGRAARRRRPPRVPAASSATRVKLGEAPLAGRPITVVRQLTPKPPGPIASSPGR